MLINNDERDSGFRCLHPLFEWEEGYIVCPSCGDLIDENLPPKEDTSDDARIYHYYMLAKRSIWSKLEKILPILIVCTVMFSGIFISKIVLLLGQYGFQSFYTSSVPYRGETVENPHGFSSIAFAIFLAWTEKYRRIFLIKLKAERFYDYLYHWSVQLLLFGVLSVLAFKYYPPMAQYYASTKMLELNLKYDLTVDQLVVAKELYLTISTRLAIIAAIGIIVYNLVVTGRAKYLRQLNEEYLDW